MPLVNKTLPGLYNGVSQQPPTLRLENQCEIQENALSLLVDGILKRPGTEWVANLNSKASFSSHIHTINRDTNERYKVIFTADPTEPIEIYTLEGEKCVVDYETSQDKDYVLKDEDGNTIKPRQDIRCVTVADHTLIVNTKRRVKMKPASGSTPLPTGLIHVKRCFIQTTYTVKVKDVNGAEITSQSYTTPKPADAEGNTMAKTDDIASELFDKLKSALSDTQWQLKLLGSTIRIRNTARDFALEVSDSYGNQALFAIKGSVQKFQDLPPEAEDGFSITVEGTDRSTFDNFYVKYKSNPKGAGVWEETVAFWDSEGNPLSHVMDADTLPHRLIRVAHNTFTLKKIEWEPRRIGDDISAPAPSFVNETIKDIFFFKNRLGFLSGENVIMSRAGDFFNLFPSTATDILDGDPIDVAVSTTKVAVLEHAVPFANSLLLTSDQQQFILSSAQGLLTPSTVAIDPSTNFETSVNCKPVGAGPNLYFVVPNGSYSSIREYYVQADTQTNDAADVTGHVPRYLPNNISVLASSSAQDILFALSPDEPKTLYVYKYYWNGEEKIQSSWSKWLFDDEILDVALLENWLYFITRKDDQTSLQRMSLEKTNTDNLHFRVHLDKMVKVVGVYDETTNTTTWTLPYTDSSEDFTVVEGLLGNQILQITKTSPNTLQTIGNLSDRHCYIGKNYIMRYRFSRWYLRDENNVANTQGSLQIRTLTLAYTDTSYFKVVTKNQQAVFTGVILGSSELGKPSILTGEHRVYIGGNAWKTDIDIINDTYLPSQLQTASYEGFWTTRSRAY